MPKNKGLAVTGKAATKVTFTQRMSLKKDTKPGVMGGGALAFEADELTAGAEFNSVAVGSIYVRKEKLQKVYKKATVTVVLED